MREQFLKGGIGYGDFKKQLFAKLWEISPADNSLDRPTAVLPG
jgi:hypothetical protein